jgi:nicotinate-nucleotide--dimethylbenzimidazole phosphoribosyltransferase
LQHGAGAVYEQDTLATCRHTHEQFNDLPCPEAFLLMTDRPSPFPFNDILALIDELPPMPSGNGCGGPATADVSLPVPGGTLAAHAAWLARWQDSATPRLRRPVVAVFAASHAEPAVSASGDSIARVEDFVAASQSREALVCRVCDRHGLGLRVFELAPEIPVADFASDAAMDEADCAATMAYGMEATAGGADLLVLRACAAGHEASVAAMAALLLGPGDGNDVVTSLAARAEALHRAHKSAPLEILRRVGGRENAALAGAILAARLQQVPVILDGAGAVAVAVLLDTLRPGTAAHCLIAASDGHADFDRLRAASGLPVVLAGCHLEGDGTIGALAAAQIQTAVELSAPAGSEPGVRPN